MTVTCPHCEETLVKVYGDPCSVCGKRTTMDDVVRPLHELLGQLDNCSICRAEKSFDGWHCYVCTHTISDKAKKAHGCVLVNKKEVELVTKYFQTKGE